LLVLPPGGHLVWCPSISCRHKSRPDDRSPFEHGEIVDLVYFHGKSVKEVAQIVGIAPATVKTRMFYARKKLADFVAAA
jgi:plasmid maintenance system antidote protein VapI